ncbi:hypothetical protein INR49_015762 [Caranx melampygus]|nr:hypothetical protein INR49_015762 [Caranx melampygus]
MRRKPIVRHGSQFSLVPSFFPHTTHGLSLHPDPFETTNNTRVNEAFTLRQTPGEELSNEKKTNDSESPFSSAVTIETLHPYQQGAFGCRAHWLSQERDAAGATPTVARRPALSLRRFQQ